MRLLCATTWIADEKTLLCSRRSRAHDRIWNEEVVDFDGHVPQ